MTVTGSFNVTLGDPAPASVAPRAFAMLGGAILSGWIVILLVFGTVTGWRHLPGPPVVVAPVPTAPTAEDWAAVEAYVAANDNLVTLQERTTVSGAAVVATERTDETEDPDPTSLEHTFQLMLADGVFANSATVSCPGGVRVRAPFVGGVATLAGVPLATCSITLQGGNPATFRAVPGQYRCQTVAGEIRCR